MPGVRREEHIHKKYTWGFVGVANGLLQSATTCISKGLEREGAGRGPQGGRLTCVARDPKEN